MIKGSELRTSNRIWESSSLNPQPEDFEEIVIASVNDIDKVVHDEQDNIYSYDYLYPIPLTPEWLERCGFKRMNAGWINDSGSLSFYDKDSETGNGVYKMEYGTRNYAAGFLYLHQLQNLYFALTGEELEIKN